MTPVHNSYWMEVYPDAVLHTDKRYYSDAVMVTEQQIHKMDFFILLQAKWHTSSSVIFSQM